MIRRVLPVLIVLAAGLRAWQVDVPYALPETRRIGESTRLDTAWYFDTTRVAGKYARTKRWVHEGGWSGLERDTTDPTGASFWTVSEGGLAVSRESAGRNDRLIAFPGYHQKIAHLVLRDGAVEIDRIDSIASWGDPSAYTNGLRNTVSTSDAVTLRMDLATGGAVPGDTLPASDDGFDLEAIRLRNGSIWLADESGPFLLRLDAATRRIEREWSPDAGLPKVFARRRSNRGFEAMATTPGGLVAAVVQSPLLNAQGTVDNSSTRDSRVMRMVVLDPESGTVREHVVLNDQKPGDFGPTRKGRDCKIGDMVALDESRFVIVEHGEDDAGTYWIDLWLVDISGATNVTATNRIGMTFAGGTQTLEQVSDSATLVADGVIPAAKTLLRGNLAGTTPWTSHQPEGLALVDDSTMALLSDDNQGCREMDSAGAVDGICHLRRAGENVSTLMYVRVPPLSARTGVHRLARVPARVSAVADGIRVRWAATEPFAIELRDLSGRLLRSEAIDPGGRAGETVVRFHGASGLLAVRLVDARGATAATLVPSP